MRIYQFIDRVGQKYGKLTVVKYLYTRNYKTYWQCQCDCGNQKITTGHALQHFSRKTGSGVGSCGCLHAESAAKKRLPDHKAGFRKVWTQYRTQAKSSGRQFSLSEEVFRKLITQNCKYCGIEPKSESHPSKRKAEHPFLYNGIDRIDSSQGYTIENCVPCCKYCNRAKSDRNLSQFLDWIQNVFNTSCTLSSSKN